MTDRGGLTGSRKHEPWLLVLGVMILWELWGSQAQASRLLLSPELERQFIGETLSSDQPWSAPALTRALRASELAEQWNRNFSSQDQFDEQGRMIHRVRSDGTEEELRYSMPGQACSVWVRNHAGEFQEERFYLNDQLRAILSAQGSLTTLQFSGGWDLQKSPYPLFLIRDEENITRVYEFRSAFRGHASYTVKDQGVQTDSPPVLDRLDKFIAPASLRCFSED